MLRDGLNHVLCRKRRDVIEQRELQSYRWKRERQKQRGMAAVLAWKPSVRFDWCTAHAELRDIVAAEVQRTNQLVMEDLRQLGVV